MIFDFEDTEKDLHNKLVYTLDVTYMVQALVLAMEAMGMKPTFKGEDTYLSLGVSYCTTCNRALYQGSEATVVGHNLEAMEEVSEDTALYLAIIGHFFS